MDKMKQWALLTAVAILAIAVGGWFVLISPQRSHASELRTKTASQQQHNDQLRIELQTLQQEHKGLPEVQAELAKLGVQLPNNPALPALIRSLSSAAEAAGVDLISLAPSQPAGVGAPASGAPAGGNAGALQSVPIAVVVNGGYFQVEQFTSNLEALPRPFLTTTISMCPEHPPAPGAASGSCLDT